MASYPTSTKTFVTKIIGDVIEVSHVNDLQDEVAAIETDLLNGNVFATKITTGLNAAALSTGTIPLARLTSANTSANGVVDTTTQSFAGDKTFTNNVTVTGTITGNVTGTVSNATNRNSQPGSYYTNASNLSTGTLAIARLDANVILTTSTTGINASALSTGTVPLARLTSANTSANGVVDTTTQTFAGNKTFQNTTSFSNTVSITGAANALNTFGVTGTLTALGQLSVTGNATFTDRVILTSTAGIQANGSIGTAGQLLYSNASSAYWATPTYASPDDVIALAIALG